MDSKEPADITLEVLISIRDEIRGLREDTNKRFEQMDKRFERIEEDIAQMRHDIGYIVTKFDRDLLLMASEMDSMKKRLQVCEQHCYR